MVNELDFHIHEAEYLVTYDWCKLMLVAYIMAQYIMLGAYWMAK